MFRRVPSVIRSFSLYTQQWYMSYRFADVYHSCVYSEKLLMTEEMSKTCMVCYYNIIYIIILKTVIHG